MLITAFYLFRQKGQQETRNKVVPLSSAKHLVGFKPGIFRFQSERLNSLGHSPLDTFL